MLKLKYYGKQLKVKIIVKLSEDAMQNFDSTITPNLRKTEGTNNAGNPNPGKLFVPNKVF